MRKICQITVIRTVYVTCYSFTRVTHASLSTSPMAEASAPGTGQSANFSFVVSQIDDTSGYRIGDNTNISQNGFTGSINETLVIPHLIRSQLILEVGAYAFRCSEIIKYLIIDEGIERLGNSSFRNSTLSYVSLPSSLKRLDWNVFDDCYYLETVHINQPSKLEWIDTATFSTCKKLKSFIVPETVKYISHHVFDGIETNFTVYYCGNTIFEKDIFHTTTTLTIFVPRNGVRTFGNRPTRIGSTPCNVMFIGTCKVSKINLRYQLTFFVIMLSM